MTTQEVVNAVDADEYTKGWMTADRNHNTIEQAENAEHDEPLMSTLRKAKWEKFWAKRGSNPITDVVEEYAN